MLVTDFIQDFRNTDTRIMQCHARDWEKDGKEIEKQNEGRFIYISSQEQF